MRHRFTLSPHDSRDFFSKLLDPGSLLALGLFDNAGDAFSPETGAVAAVAGDAAAAGGAAFLPQPDQPGLADKRPRQRDIICPTLFDDLFCQIEAPESADNENRTGDRLFDAQRQRKVVRFLIPCIDLLAYRVVVSRRRRAAAHLDGVHPFAVQCFRCEHSLVDLKPLLKEIRTVQLDQHRELGADRCAHAFINFPKEPAAVLDAASISIGTPVRVGLQELVDEIAVRGM